MHEFTEDPQTLALEKKAALMYREYIVGQVTYMVNFKEEDPKVI